MQGETVLFVRDRRGGLQALGNIRPDYRQGMVWLLCAIVAIAAAQTRIELAGTWLLDGPNATGVPVQVPGDIYTDMHAAGIIGDPLYRYGDLEYAWVGRGNYTYSLHFTVSADDLQARDVQLIFEGIETNATVTLNGAGLLTASDEWRRYSARVTDRLRVGQNNLSVTFTSLYDVCLYADPDHIANCTRTWDRQDQSSWGWDWAPRFSPQGIWKPVYLLLTNTTAIVRASAIAHNLGVAVTAVVFAPRPLDVYMTVDCTWPGCQPQTQPIRLQAGNNTISQILTAPSTVPRWTPHLYGTGPRALFDVVITVVDGMSAVLSSHSVKNIGFRAIALVTDNEPAGPDANGSGNSSFYLMINGQRVLCRGSNLVPFSMFNGQVTEAYIARTLQSFVDANMNTLRIWGGGTYLPDYFYDECDRLGIMVIHDQMFTWYPHVPYYNPPAFAAQVTAELEEQLARIGHHPSIVLWTANNEDQCSRYKNAGQTVELENCLSLYIDTVLATIVSVDPSRPIWPSCPNEGLDSGVNRPTGLPNKQPLKARLTGPALDTHGPYGCAGAAGMRYPTEPSVLFHSEFGCLSLPQFETLAPQLNGSAGDYSIFSPVMVHRMSAGGELYNMLSTNFPSYDWKASTECAFRRAIYLSQINQAECLRYIVDGGRLSTTTRPDGYLFWQLNDIWQASSWGSLDYGGRWRVVHARSQQFFAPVYAACNVDEKYSTVTCTGVNDSPDPVTVELRLSIVPFAAGGVATSIGTSSVTLAAGQAATIYHDSITHALPPGGTPQTHYLFGTSAIGDVYAWFAPLEHLALGRADLSLSVAVGENVLVTISNDGAAGPAIYCVITTAALGRFSDNGFHLLPGASIDLVFTPFAELEPFDPLLFEQSLSVHALNDGPCPGMQTSL
eukprot:m.92429 g.92429  ORF g.92429 m.92429 type:complete len:897 (-) comp8512_c0_seq1:138-2828(-)